MHPRSQGSEPAAAGALLLSSLERRKKKRGREEEITSSSAKGQMRVTQSVRMRRICVYMHG